MSFKLPETSQALTPSAVLDADPSDMSETSVAAAGPANGVQPLAAQDDLSLAHAPAVATVAAIPFEAAPIAAGAGAAAVQSLPDAPWPTVADAGLGQVQPVTQADPRGVDSHLANSAAPPPELVVQSPATGVQVGFVPADEPGLITDDGEPLDT